MVIIGLLLGVNKLKHKQHKVKHNNEKWNTSISQPIQKVFVGPDFWLPNNFVILASQKLGCYRSPPLKMNLVHEIRKRILEDCNNK